jgi:hypothetical protein
VSRPHCKRRAGCIRWDDGRSCVRWGCARWGARCARRGRVETGHMRHVRRWHRVWRQSRR